MKQLFFLFLVAVLKTVSLQGQQNDCNFKSPVIIVNFGDDANPEDLSLSNLKKYYRPTKSICPDDGAFSFVSYTHNCFNDNWIPVDKDHTTGSVNGHMMLVNAAFDPATFFTIALNNLKPNTTYELSAWFVNVCRRGENCEPTPPDIRISIFADGNLLTKFYTGSISPTGVATWRRCAGNFTTPSVVSKIVVAMDDITTGGCGNDFAMDDIEIRECQVVKPLQTPAPTLPPAVNNKPVIKNAVPKPEIKKVEQKILEKPVISKDIAVVAKAPAVKQTTIVQPVIKSVPVPDVIKNRDNAVTERIETAASEILIELYDNGEIDGDTVSIYHNNQLLVAHAGLSVKPVTVKIKVDKEHPHHELIMVADNLGSIPPNTSLMVLTTKYKRYEVFISSTEKKNAKLIIDLQSE